jgi:cyclic-di-GMP-binding protein
MTSFSFDIVSEIDKAEVNNVFLMSEKEIANRYDFKGTTAVIEWLDNKSGYKICGANDMHISSIEDIIRKKLTSRGQSSKIIDFSQKPTTSNLVITKHLPFVEKLDQDKAKQITKILRDSGLKIKPQIQGEAVRVVSSSKDDLQKTIQLLNTQNLDFPINFINYR